MTNTDMSLRDAAQAVIDRWETPLWKDAPATAVFIADLRQALARDAGRASMQFPGFTAADMATASAQGFRDGVASVAASAPAPSEHIKEPYTLAEVKAKIASNDYSAEMLLQHAMLLLDSASLSANAGEPTPPVAPPMVGEIALIEKALESVGITSLLNHGAASCVFTEGCCGVSQDHILAYTRKIALHCAVALAAPPTAPQPTPATQQAGEVRRAELVPGVMHCAKCKFQLNRVTLCVSDGNAYAGNNKTEPCPNGCGPLWPVTWEQEAKNCWKALEEMHERLMAAAAPQPSPTAQAASSAVLKAIREANMQLVRTGDNAFMLVPYKVATAQAAESVPAPVLDSLALMKVVMQADEALSGRCTRGTTNWAAHIGKAVQNAVIAKLWTPEQIAEAKERAKKFDHWLATTPQPTHAQAGAVPLDEARRLFDAGWKAAALFCDREDVVADGIIGFGACPQFEAAFSAAQGIQGKEAGMLTNEQIDAEVFARWGDMKGAPLAMCRGFARAIEAEVRKDDEALIGQLEIALSWSSPHADAAHGWKSENWARKRSEAITAARARLLDSDLSNLTERGAKAWAGVDAQKLREDGTT